MPTEGVVARVRGALDRLDAVAARTNCIADRNDDAVLVAAAAAERGVLHGEPITVKDWIDVTGFRCSGGDVLDADRWPSQDAPAIARLRRAGAVVVAKTAVLVDSELFGRVLNPHDVLRSPGGSSSGEGATVGSGAVGLGIGSDSGGSIRVPAAWCQVIGMKPSAGLIPLSGHLPRLGERSDGRTVIGPIARSVELAWTALTVMAGPDGADGGVAPVVLGDPYEVDISSLRFAVGSPGGAEVSPVMADALNHVADILQSAGATVAGPPPDWLNESRRITEAYWNRAERTGRQIEQDLFDWDRFRRRTLIETSEVDLIITPTVAETAPRHRPMETEDYLFCLPASLTGAPAISMPAGDGAVQIIGHRWADHVAVAAARVIEGVTVPTR